MIKIVQVSALIQNTMGELIMYHLLQIPRRARNYENRLKSGSVLRQSVGCVAAYLWR